MARDGPQETTMRSALYSIVAGIVLRHATSLAIIIAAVVQDCAGHCLTGVKKKLENMLFGNEITPTQTLSIEAVGKQKA